MPSVTKKFAAKLAHVRVRVPGATPQLRFWGVAPGTRTRRRRSVNKTSRSKAAKIHAENSGPLFASPDWFLAGDCIAVAQDGIVLAHSGSHKAKIVVKQVV